MPMYNLTQYSKSYSKTSDTLSNYARYIPVDSVTKSSKYKTSIAVKTTDEGNTKVGFSVPLKHLSNFWRALDMPLISCEISLTLTYSKSNNW